MHPTLSDLLAYVAKMHTDTPVALTRDDAPDNGPCIILEDVLAELAPPDDTARAFGPGRAAPAWWRT